MTAAAIRRRTSPSGLGMTVIRHAQNSGYGANQKTCYDAALAHGADVVIMIHPDYQYDGRIAPSVVSLLATGTCDVILGSRIRTRRETLEGGMPVYKYLSNRLLTAFENIALGQNLGDLHTGFRAYAREVLETVNYHANSDDFVFDSEFLAQCVYHGFRIGDVPIPTRYFSEASSINFRRSLKYGLQTVSVVAKYWLARAGVVEEPPVRFGQNPAGKRPRLRERRPCRNRFLSAAEHRNRPCRHFNPFVPDPQTSAQRRARPGCAFRRP